MDPCRRTRRPKSCARRPSTAAFSCAKGRRPDRSGSMWAVCRWLLPALAPCFGPTLACLSCSVTKGKSELGPSYVISCVGCAAPEISPYKYSHHYIVRQHRQPSWRTGACGGGGAGDFVMSASPCVSRVCVCVCARTYTHTHTRTRIPSGAALSQRTLRTSPDGLFSLAPLCTPGDTQHQCRAAVHHSFRGHHPHLLQSGKPH